MDNRIVPCLIKIGILVAILFPVISWCDESETLSLNNAIKQALDQSPKIQSLQQAAESASWKKLEALSGHLPHISIEADQYLEAKYERMNVEFNGATINFPAAYPQSVINFDVSLTLFDGLGTINAYRAAGMSAEAADFDLKQAKFQLEEEIKKLFYHALGAKLLSEVALQNIVTLEQHLAIAKASNRTGYTTSFEVLRIEAQLEEARAEQLLADDNVSIARDELSKAMGLEGDPRPLVGQLPVPIAQTFKINGTKAFEDRYDVKALVQREKASDRQSAASAAFWMPKISIFGEEQFFKFGNFDPVILPDANFENAYSLGLRLTWNLFDGGASIARQQEAIANSKQAAAATRAVVLQIPSEVRKWEKRYQYNSALYRARLTTISKSQESVRLATIGVKAGVRTHTEVLDAELDLFRARAGAVQAQIDASDAKINLEQALGKHLEG